ncbi:MAG: MIP/aquaporin family protein [Verrucomicrobiota bacterium]
MKSKKPLLSEILGTFLLVFFGCSAVATAVAMGAQVGIFQVAIVWGFGLMVAILLTAKNSGAHLNPAITIAMALHRNFAWKRVPGYIFAQFVGAFAAAGLIYALYGGAIASFEAANGITRGAEGSEASAMIFGEYFPNPSGKPITDEARASISNLHAFLAELIGTALLALAIFGFTDRNNTEVPSRMIPFGIGLTLTVLISLLAPISQGGFNPARDFAPRLLSTLVGWGNLPFSLNGLGWLTVYIIAPCLGAIIGGYAYKLFLKPGYKAK